MIIRGLGGEGRAMDTAGEPSAHEHERAAGRRLPERRWLVLAAVAVLVVGGVGYWFMRGPAEQASMPKPLTAAALLPACAGGRGTAFTASPPYRGSAPHPILHLAFHDGPDGAVPEQDTFPSRFPDWNPDGTQPEQWQVVACTKRISADKAEAKSCPLGANPSSGTPPALGDLLGLNGDRPPTETITFSMHRARWEITLRELRSHREIAHATITGDDLTCPHSVDLPAIVADLPDDDVVRQEYTQLYSQPTIAQWKAAFDRYLTGPAT